MPPDQDEMCSCGHKRSDHRDRFDQGHGACTLCYCPQFTWVKFLDCPYGGSAELRIRKEETSHAEV